LARNNPKRLSVLGGDKIVSLLLGPEGTAEVSFARAMVLPHMKSRRLVLVGNKTATVHRFVAIGF
jgi:hypothetical protein